MTSLQLPSKARLRGATRLSLADMLRNELQIEEPVSTEGTALSDIFEHEPVPLNVFVGDSTYLAQHPYSLSEVQYGFVRHFEQILHPATYALMVEEFGESWLPVRYCNEFAIEWGKGSQRRSAPIYNARTGQWDRLDSFAGGDVASAYPEDGKVFVAQGTKSFREGYGRMFKVTTKSGLTAEVWEGHRFLTRGVMKRSGEVPVEWKRLWDISVGDRIAVSSFVPEPTESVRLPDHEVEIAGLFVGDGCYSPGYRNPAICGGALAVKTLARTQELLSALPNASVRVATREDGKWDVYTRTVSKQGRRGGAPNPLKHLLGEYDLLKGAHDKRVPQQIFSAPTDQVALFLSRLIDTDGWIRISNTVEVGYGTVSHDLAEDVRRLLLRLGVASGVRQKNGIYNGGPHTSWQVKVRDRRSVQTLLQQLMLLDKEPVRLGALAWCEERSTHKMSRHMLGDLWFDTIAGIEYMDDDEYWTLSVDGPADYIANSGILDHNSGKDFSVQVAFARLANLLLCLKSPQDYYGMPHQTIIHMMNVAASAPQAHGVFFKPLRTLLTRSPWFNGTHGHDFKFEGDLPGPQAIEMRFTKQVELISGHSQAETLEGKNLLAAVADEISAFPTIAETKARTGRTPARSADAIIDMLKSSATTRFPEHFKLAQISYPRYQGDAIEKAIEKGHKDNKINPASRFYVSGPIPTWDVNPRYDVYERIEVPGATEPVPNVPSIIGDYASDPAYARAKYECRPELAEHRFMGNDAAIAAAFSPRSGSPSLPDYQDGVDPLLDEPPVTIEYYYGTDTSDSAVAAGGYEATQVPGWQVRFVYHPEFRPILGALYAIHGDMAISGDAAGVAMCHVASYDTREDQHAADQRTEMRPQVTMDFATSFTADPSATVPEDYDDSTIAGQRVAREVQIRWYRKLVWELKARGFAIASVSNDGFESADALQILSAWGLNAQRISVDRLTGSTSAPYETLKDVLYDGRLRGYPHKRLVSELQRLQKLSNGKIDHPSDFGKDIADALAASVYAAVSVGGQEEGSEGAPLYADSAEVLALYDSVFGGAPVRTPDRAAAGFLGVSDGATAGTDPFADVAMGWDEGRQAGDWQW